MGASLRGVELGAPLAIEIAIHNIFEGLPLRGRSFSPRGPSVQLWEPAGVLVMFAILSTNAFERLLFTCEAISRALKRSSSQINLLTSYQTSLGVANIIVRQVLAKFDVSL